MSNIFRKLRRTSSSSSLTRLDIMQNKLKITQENTERVANEFSVAINTTEDCIKNWEIPKKDITQIYKQGSFLQKNEYYLKVVEKVHMVGAEFESIQLLSQKDIDYIKLKNKDFQYLHIGSVQVGVEVLAASGNDLPICLCLRDARHNRYLDSLIGAIQANLSDRPVYFDCYPNIKLGLREDGAIPKTLTLDVRTKNVDMDPLAKNINIVYRVYYKAYTTNVKLECLIEASPKKETVMFLASPKANVTTRSIIPWEELTHSGRWEFPNIVTPKPVVDRQPALIKELSDGTVIMDFDRPRMSTGSRYTVSSSRRYKDAPSRFDETSASAPPLERPPSESSRPSFAKLAEVDFKPDLPQPRYSDEDG